MELTNAQKVKVAKARAKERGSYGAGGGWIYNKSGTAIAQGWLDYYAKFCRKPG